MSFPNTADEIQTRLDTVEDLIQTYLASPAKFAAMIAGSAKLDIPGYVKALQDERAILQKRLESCWLRQSDAEQVQ
jgi:hypothetical protein